MDTDIPDTKHNLLRGTAHRMGIEKSSRRQKFASLDSADRCCFDAMSARDDLLDSIVAIRILHFCT